jgi:hypothetical protein
MNCTNPNSITAKLNKTFRVFFIQAGREAETNAARRQGEFGFRFTV